jgi:hypothetical protein
MKESSLEKKKRVTIYVRVSEWRDIRKAAIDRGVSAGEFLLGFYRDSKAGAGSVKVDQPDKFDSHRPMKADTVFVPDEVEVPVEAKKPVVDKVAIQDLQGKIDAIAGGRSFMPYSKARQVGKKEK